jgi:hypothetical protein
VEELGRVLGGEGRARSVEMLRTVSSEDSSLLEPARCRTGDRLSQAGSGSLAPTTWLPEPGGNGRSEA